MRLRKCWANGFAALKMSISIEDSEACCCVMLVYLFSAICRELAR